MSPGRRARASLLTIAGRAPMHGFPRRRFGLFEALAYPWIGSFEWLRRMQLVVDALEQVRQSSGLERLSVLDFGGSSGYLAVALRLWGVDRSYDVTLADIDGAAIEAADVAAPIVAKLLITDEEGLPIASDGVDVTFSGDVFEHIPRERRPFWAGEIDRVSRLGQVHTMPCDGDDGETASTAADAAFLEWHERTLGTPERWTTEHREYGLPTLPEVRELFGESRIDTLMNTGVWLESVKVQFVGMRVARVRFIARYLLRLRSVEREPPFKSCIVVVTRRRSDRAVD